jgi:hypothetical protein
LDIGDGTTHRTAICDEIDPYSEFLRTGYISAIVPYKPDLTKYYWARIDNIA